MTSRCIKNVDICINRGQIPIKFRNLVRTGCSRVADKLELLFGQCQLHANGMLHRQHVCLGQLANSGFESHLVGGHELVGHGFAFAACKRYPRFAGINLLCVAGQWHNNDSG